MSFRTLLPLLVLSCLLVDFRLTRASELGWPLRGDIDLASGFGDYRDGRFHAGLDLRTGGAVGVPVYSPVDGCVWRIKTSYVGYGKALYIRGRDGLIYVFGHLSAYAPAIDAVVKREQIRAERYSLDLMIPADSIPVKKQSVIAYSGQTGAGAPHLHFEQRVSDEYPLNPLQNGFALKDKTSPTLTRIGLQLVDDHSLFSNGERKLFLPVQPGKSPRQFKLDTVLYLNAPTGLLLDGYDRIRPEGMKQSIARLSLQIDGRPVYESRFDTLAFATGKSVYFEYDFAQADSGEARVRRLFHQSPDAFAGSRWFDSARGVIGAQGLAIGRHEGVVTAQDAFGNTSALAFAFMWGPATPVVVLDSTVKPSLDSTIFFFSATHAYDSLRIDSTDVQFNVGESWGPTSSATLSRPSHNRFVLTVTAFATSRAVLRLIHHYKGGRIYEEPFNGLISRGIHRATLSHQLVDDGMIVTCQVGNAAGSQARLDLYCADSVVGRIPPARFFNGATYRFFVSARPEYRRIDSLAVVPETDSTTTPAAVEACRIWAVGYAPVDTVSVDSLCAVIVSKEALFEPRLVELDKLILSSRSLYKMNSDAYKLLPESFPTRDNIRYQVFMNIPNDKSYLTGLCRFDFKNGKWAWRSDSKFHSDTVFAGSASGGTFAAVFDSHEPEITKLSIRARQTVYEDQPLIQFNLRDTLSGIADDRSIDIKLDRKWMIPEYDPETGICTTRPLEPLKNGDHHLAIKVTDRAGNLAEQYLIFTVAKRNTPPRK
jgi:hypothetical protein